jgi:hypothetical protein
VIAGTDEDDAGRIMHARSRKGVLESNVWAGSARSLVWWLEGLETAGATWVVLVPAGPPDRLELIADQVFPSMRARS